MLNRCMAVTSLIVFAGKLSGMNENRAGDSKLPAHLLPPVVSELGEIGLFILDIIWHHDLVQHIEEVGTQVASLDEKVDSLLNALQQLPSGRSDDPKIEEDVAADNEIEGRSETKVGNLLTLALSTSVFAFAQWLAPYLG